MQGTTLVLIRHGHALGSGDSPEPRLSGWADFPLTARGHDQVGRLAERLAREPPFSLIYSSPLERALDTARVLSAAGLGTLRLHAGLREINCGDLDGAPLELVQRRYAELWAANLRQDDDDFRWPGGDSYAELRERARSTVEEIAQRHAGERVALVTHAGVIGQLVGLVAGTRAARWEAHRPENASLSVFIHWGGALSLARFNDCQHLEVGESEPATRG